MGQDSLFSNHLEEDLTRREVDILELLAGEGSNQEIADQLYLSLNTVKGYIRQIYQKLGVNNRRSAITRARELGLLEGGVLRTSPKHNLPIQLTSFIGREVEIAQVGDLLKQHRLVTLTGVGGTGKTRLALEVADGVLQNYPDGLWLVDLAPLADPDMVPSSLASTLGLLETSGTSILGTLIEFIKRKKLLLLLDNCEHLRDACASLVNRILQACLDVSILATSREILGVKGEIPFLVPPLSRPVDHQALSINELLEFDAVNLFVDRARVSFHDFELTGDNAALALDIVRSLDGIPLAIELAAARLRLLGLEQIARRLDDVFSLLKGGSRTGLPRQQTLRASIDWSYDLLSEAERILLRRLSVFTGSWRLQAAEAICSDIEERDARITPGMILDLVSELVDKSLIYATISVEGINRYRMLGPIRQYASEKLFDAKEAGPLRTRHLAYYLEMVESLEPKLHGREQVQSLDILESELGNLRLALEWALQTDVESELRLASALKWFWHIRSLWSEGSEWLQLGLAKEDEISKLADRPGSSPIPGKNRPASATIQAKALAALGLHLSMSLMEQRERTTGGYGKASSEEATKAMQAAREALEKSVRLYRQAGEDEQEGLAFALRWLSILVVNPEYAHEALDVCRKIDDKVGIFESLFFVGIYEPDLSRRNKLHREQLAVAESFDDDDLIASALSLLGSDAYEAGEYNRTRDFYQRSYQQYRKVGNLGSSANQLRLTSKICLLMGDYAQASQSIELALQIYRDVGRQIGYLDSLDSKFELLLSQGDFDQAAEVVHEEQVLSQETEGSDFQAKIKLQQGMLARLQGDTGEARQLLRECLEITRQENILDLAILSFNELGKLALIEDDLSEAEESFREAVQIGIEDADLRSRGYLLASLAGMAVRNGEMEKAARLFGTAEHFCPGLFNTLPPPDRIQLNADLKTAQEGLGETLFKQLYEEGMGSGLEQTLTLALEEMHG